MERRGAYTGPFLDLGIARTINHHHGGAVIAAWQVGQLDTATLDTYMALTSDLPKRRQATAKIDAKKNEIRAQFAKYRN